MFVCVCVSVYMYIIYTYIYRYNVMYSAIKNKIRPFAATWMMNLEINILSEVRQISYDITYMWNLKKIIQTYF